jgi:hypothetical protein
MIRALMECRCAPSANPPILSPFTSFLPKLPTYWDIPFCLFYAKTAVAEFRQGVAAQDMPHQGSSGSAVSFLAHLNRPEAASLDFFLSKVCHWIN